MDDIAERVRMELAKKHPNHPACQPITVKLEGIVLNSVLLTVLRSLASNLWNLIIH